MSTDSRSIRQGQIFFALHGDSFDGNRYAQQALEAGALAAVVDDPAAGKSAGIIQVEDSLESLQHLARHHRRQVGAKLIAITGSNGKTTSKELIRAVLSTTFKVFASEGNLNNHIGVPLTLLRIKPDHEFAVIEMGANHRGEIAHLCSMAEPDYGVVTNVGKAHLEGFGGMEGVIASKKELFDYLAQHDGLAFINVALPHLEQMARHVSRKVTYGERGDVCGLVLNDRPTLRLEIGWKDGVLDVGTQLIGNYNFNNVLLAATVGLHFGVAPEKVQAGIEAYVPSNNRSQIIHQGSNTIILDAYNANPSSMEAALENLAKVDAKNRVAILGDMLELGAYSAQEHERIARMAIMVADVVALVGEQFRASDRVIRARLTQGEGSQLLHFTDAPSCRVWFAQQSFQDAAILIKGSRKVGLEAVVTG